MDKAFPLTSVASVRWSRKLTQKCRKNAQINEDGRQEMCLHSFSVISGQSGVVICQLWFNYKAVKTMLSNKRPLSSSFTSKNCSRRRWRRRRGVHQRGPWINDTAGEEMRGRRQAVETRHMTQSWKMWMFHLTKPRSFMLLYFISRQYHDSYMFFFLELLWLWKPSSPPPVTSRLLHSDVKREHKSFCSDHLPVGGRVFLEFWPLRDSMSVSANG